MFHNFLKDNNVVKIDMFQIIHKYTVFLSPLNPNFFPVDKSLVLAICCKCFQSQFSQSEIKSHLS